MRAIQDVLLAEFGEQVAKRVLTKMMKKIRCLELYPLAGINLSAMFGLDCDYRYLYTEKNYVFYRVETQRIKIVRILNERQDFVRVLFGILPASEETDEDGND